MKTKLLILALAGMMCGCATSTSELPDSSSFSVNLIQEYIMPSGVRAYQYEREYICMEFRGRSVDYRGEESGPEYQALAEKYNDLSYNRNVVGPFPQVLGVEYSAIDVTCNVALGEEYPAGKSLGDMIKLCAISWARYIANGYDHTLINPPLEPYSVWWFEGVREYPVFKFLNEVTREDLILVEPTMYLYFTKTPPAGEYEFTINVLLGEDGGSDTAGENAGAGDLTTTVRMTF